MCIGEGRWRSCCSKSLPISINSPSEYPHRSTQRYVSPLIPEPMKLWRLSITDTNLSLDRLQLSVFLLSLELSYISKMQKCKPSYLILLEWVFSLIVFIIIAFIELVFFNISLHLRQSRVKLHLPPNFLKIIEWRNLWQFNLTICNSLCDLLFLCMPDLRCVHTDRNILGCALNLDLRHEHIMAVACPIMLQRLTSDPKIKEQKARWRQKY